MWRSTGRLVALLVVVLSLALVPSVAAAETKVNFGALYLNGDAALAGSTLRLTHAAGNLSSSAFTPWPLTLAEGASFSTSFSFAMYGAGGIGAADGIVFVLQPGTRTALSQGGGLGFLGIPDSFGVEFDTWFNSSVADPDDNHVGVDLGGSCVSTVTASMPWRMAAVPVNYAWIDYDGEDDRLEVRVSTSPSRPATATLACDVDLSEICGTTVFAGFTSATGSGCQVHEIRSWSLGGGLGARARVLAPHAASTMRRGRFYTIYGYVEPEHLSGANLATLKFYRRNSHGTYVYHHSVDAKRFAYSATRSKYSVKTSIPHTGRWRVRARHSCSLHTTSYSGYDYITVD